MKGVTVTAVDIIMREDGVCKGFAECFPGVSHRDSDINTDCDSEDSIAKLIKLYNGAKWKGKVLKSF